MLENGDLITLTKHGNHAPFPTPNEKKGIEKLAYHPEQKLFFLYPYFYYGNTHWNKLSFQRPDNILAANLRIGTPKQDISDANRVWAPEYVNRGVIMQLLIEHQDPPKPSQPIARGIG